MPACAGPSPWSTAMPCSTGQGHASWTPLVDGVHTLRAPELAPPASPPSGSPPAQGQPRSKVGQPPRRRPHGTQSAIGDTERSTRVPCERADDVHRPADEYGLHTAGERAAWPMLWQRRRHCSYDPRTCR